MDKQKLKAILRDFKEGRKNLEEVLEDLKHLPYEDLGFARLDSHRELRTGYPEVVFCQGKTNEQIIEIFKRISKHGQSVIATRADEEVYKAVFSEFPKALYHDMAKIIHLPGGTIKKVSGKILVVTGGTSDIPVAEEAAVTAELFGNRVERIYDIGVAGVHRLLDNREHIFSANVIIVVAGMEGALASVVGGLVDKPVIAVPTSVGYGASFQGLAPLLTMLNSCAPGVAVVNIDNGFGAGYIASMINKMGEEKI